MNRAVALLDAPIVFVNKDGSIDSCITHKKITNQSPLFPSFPKMKDSDWLIFLYLISYAKVFFRTTFFNNLSNLRLRFDIYCQY